MAILAIKIIFHLLLIYERSFLMKTLEELKQELEVVEQVEPQSIKETFEKIQELAKIRKSIKALEQEQESSHEI